MKTCRPACPSPGHPDVEEAYQTWLDVAALYRQIIHAQFDMALPPSYPSDSLGDVLTLAHNRFPNDWNQQALDGFHVRVKGWLGVMAQGAPVNLVYP